MKIKDWFESANDELPVTVENLQQHIGMEDGPVKDKLRDLGEAHPKWLVHLDTKNREALNQWMAWRAAENANNRIFLQNDGGVVALPTHERRIRQNREGPLLVGVGLSVNKLMCCERKLTGLPIELATRGWICHRCGKRHHPDFTFEAPAEKIRLSDNPQVALTAHPGPQALADMYTEARAEAAEREVTLTCLDLRDALKRIYDDFHTTRGRRQQEKWEWCENPGNPTEEETHKRAEQLFFNIGRLPEDNENVHPLTPKWRRHPSKAGTYVVSFTDTDGDVIESEIPFGRGRPRDMDFADSWQEVYYKFTSDHKPENRLD